MSPTGRLIGLVLAIAMFVFSAFVYINSGDWVAAVFAVGSLAYGVFFLSTSSGGVDR